ncbi:MAG: hypothetical protein JNJ56_04240 [Ignavibacteria bacterium]|nr:hypothetical protein [Ignavibacteria bacterium]
MKTIILLLLALIFLQVFNGCGFLAKKYTKSETEEIRINTAGKRKISLENISGNIRIIKSSDSSAIIIKALKETKVKKKELETPFDEIKIETDTNSENISVRTVINKNVGIKFFNLGRNPTVDYDLYIPENIEIEIENINGDLSAKNLNNSLKISLVNGDAEIENYTGTLNCEITNGSFYGEVDSTEGINVSIINGSITMNLSNFMNANISAETVNGKISNENIQLRELRKEKKLLKAKIGNQETDVEIKVETVNGKIKLTGKNEI